jgi:hypothetical protein
MKNLKNVTILILFAGLLFAYGDISYSHYNTSEACIPATGEPITLGAIFPQGSLFSARSGESFQGVEAIRTAVNQCGGVNGVPIEWAYEPAADRASAEAAAQKLVGQGVPLIVGSGLSVVSSAASRIAQDAGVVYWEVSESPSAWGDWIFSVVADFQQLGTAAGSFAQINFTEPRVALIYEKRDERIAVGVREGLAQPPVIEHAYSGEICCGDAYALAVRMREARINVVILSVFDQDGERLWYALREADANIAAWIHVGSEGYRRDICESANSEGFISINPAGPVSASYRLEQIGKIDRLYRAAYRSAYGSAPSATADLSASGIYLLLKYVLPNITGKINAESIREAARALDLRDPVGLMGEGIIFDAFGANQSPAVIARQQQGRAFCSVWPESIATCSELLPFPTWRERALAVENRLSCGGDV